MFGIINNFRYLRDHKATLMSKLSPGKIKWRIWDCPCTWWQQLKRRFCIFRTLLFLRKWNWGRENWGESSFLTVFTAWTLWFLCLPQSLPGMWNLMLLPQENHWAPSIQGWSLRDAITLFQCYILFPPHGINHSRAPLCPPLSQELRGSNELLYQSGRMTPSFHDTGKNRCCPDPCKGRDEGDVTQMHAEAH